jgi:predicted O-methyltransferase YrrM
MSHPLFADIEKQYVAEMETVFIDLAKKIDNLRLTAIEQYPDIPRGTDELDSGTISLPDAKLLYLLIRYFKPKVIFEIGTWIGTSSMVMAEAIKKNANGGHIYTCDSNNYYALDNSYQDTITTINAYSDQALTTLPIHTKIDFVFADGELTFSTIKQLKPKLTKNTIITTHDFTLPAEKGVLNFARMQITSFFSYGYILHHDIINKYNSGVMALLIPVKVIPSQTFTKRLIFTLQISFVAFIVKISRKLNSYFYSKEHKTFF